MLETEVLAHRTDDRLLLAGLLGAGLSHELGNLLATASTSIFLAERDQDDKRALARHLGEARASLDRAFELSRRVLGLARGEAPERASVAVSRLVEGAVREARGLAVEVDAASDLVALCDEALTSRVLANLAANARHAGATTLRVTATRKAADIEITMIDDGSGIPEADLERIFEPLYTTGGTGLGLALSRMLAESQGGALRAAARAQGAELTLTLPSA